MAAKRKRIPRYGTVDINRHTYYRTTVTDAEGNRVSLYAKTREELYDKELEALEQSDNSTFLKKSPTVAEYCEKWLVMQSVHVRATTLTDYTSKVRRHIIKELGDKRMADVTLDDIQLALVPVSKNLYPYLSRLSFCINPFFGRQKRAGSSVSIPPFTFLPRAEAFPKKKKSL